jgi:hypothetical protein
MFNASAKAADQLILQRNKSRVTLDETAREKKKPIGDHSTSSFGKHPDDKPDHPNNQKGSYPDACLENISSQLTACEAYNKRNQNNE